MLDEAVEYFGHSASQEDAEGGLGGLGALPTSQLPREAQLAPFLWSALKAGKEPLLSVVATKAVVTLMFVRWGCQLYAYFVLRVTLMHDYRPHWVTVR